jgi:3,4-dihydroxy 2-butanone 4-phosphate synthase/GTP cyclohydrolase II
MGEVDTAIPIMVRAHREYLPGDVFGYLDRNTRNLLTSSMSHIAAAGNGVILYLKRNFNAIASELNGGLQDLRRVSTHTNALGGDFREYGIGAQILRDIGVRKIIVVSDRVPRLANLPGYGLEIVDSIPLSMTETPLITLRANGHQ